MINVYKNNCLQANDQKKASLNKKETERKVRSQCTATKSPALFQDITIEYILINK